VDPEFSTDQTLEFVFLRQHTKLLHVLTTINIAPRRLNRSKHFVANNNNRNYKQKQTPYKSTLNIYYILGKQIIDYVNGLKLASYGEYLCPPILNRNWPPVSVVTSVFPLELCAAAPPPPTECRRRAGAVFVTCSRHVVHQLYVARLL